MPVVEAALPPTLEQIRDWSRLDFDDLEQPFGDRNLQVRIDRACAYLHSVTGRPIDGSMPRQLVPLAQEAVQLRVEQIVIQEQLDYTETINDDAIATFSAGGYSETRTTPANRAGPTIGNVPPINPNPALNMDIWVLATQQMRDYWDSLLTSGNDVPAFAVTEADWGNYDGLYPVGFGVGAFRLPFPDPTVWGA